jgi:prolyl oligopeptidase
MRYPEARRTDLVETLHGRPVADPFRWLEDAESEECEAWSRAQDALVRGVLDRVPGRAALEARLRALLPGTVGAPVVVGERRFFFRREPQQELAVYCVQDGPGADVRPLLDPAVLDPSLTTVVEAALPSVDGGLVAYLTSGGGREEAVLNVLDVATGEDVAPPVLLGRGGTVDWLGSSELVVVRCLPTDEPQFHRRVFRHRVGAPIEDDELLFGEGRDKTTYYDVDCSNDGRWVVVTAALGTAPRNDAYLLDVQSGAVSVVLEGVDASAAPWVGHDGRLYIHTDLDAPRYRLCVASVSAPSPSAWRDLLPESEDEVLESVAVTADAVVAVRIKDVVASVTVHDLDSGAARAKVPLPGLGSAGVVARPDGGDECWITYADHVTPPTVFEYRVSTGSLAVWARPPGAVPVSGVAAHQVFFESKDGTRVPMFVIARTDVVRDGDNPAVLSGYGGFRVPLSPSYSASILAWVEDGGVYAVANLRGGSEYGEAWHRDGMREHKQHVFDDFAAAAEKLVADGWTRPERLGIEGGSNGGLLVGAALTQRPELFRAVVCSAPLLDMVRYEEFGLGQTWNDEYGRAADPIEFEWLVSYSPYHRVEPGVAYPAVLFTVFDGDTRVDPLHARKMCAALQYATASALSDRPVLIRRETDVGHGARALSRMIGLEVDEQSFFRAQLGLEDAPTVRAWRP